MHGTDENQRRRLQAALKKKAREDNGEIRTVPSSLRHSVYPFPDIPKIFFVFSYAKHMVNALHPATVLTFKTLVHMNNRLFDQMTTTIDRSNLILPQLAVNELLMKGFSTHNPIPLPFNKIFELLFSRADVHPLFATETFAMGINMPTKTVIFPSLQKFDGLKQFFLTPREFTQMSESAGRRRKDNAGNINIFPKHLLPTLKAITEIAFGKPPALRARSA